MGNLIKQIADELGIRAGRFMPHARYHHGMDCLYYLTTDCTYTAERVDEWLTVLWHHKEDRLVGVKLKGFKYVFSSLIQPTLGLQDSDFLPLIRALEALYNSGFGQKTMDAHTREIRQRKYDLAKEVVRQVVLTPDDVAAMRQAA